jgi:hypothetical protein
MRNIAATINGTTRRYNTSRGLGSNGTENRLNRHGLPVAIERKVALVRREIGKE